jgi:hypothetical protein
VEDPHNVPPERRSSTEVHSSIILTKNVHTEHTGADIFKSNHVGVSQGLLSREHVSHKSTISVHLALLSIPEVHGIAVVKTQEPVDFALPKTRFEART